MPNKSNLKDLGEQLAKAFQTAGERFRKEFQKVIDTQGKSLQEALRLPPNVEEAGRRIAEAFESSNQRFYQGVERMMQAQRDALQRAMKAVPKFSLPKAPDLPAMTRQVGETMMRSFEVQQKALANATEQLTAAFQAIAVQSLRAINQAAERSLKDVQSATARLEKLIAEAKRSEDKPSDDQPSDDWPS